MSASRRALRGTASAATLALPPARAASPRIGVSTDLSGPYQDIPASLVEAKKPAEGKYPGEHDKFAATTPAGEAFHPLKDGGCLLVKA